MTRVAGVRFRAAGKVYFFDPGELEISAGANVIVETARGLECGEMQGGLQEVDDDTVILPLKRIIRVATAADQDRLNENRARERQANEVFQDKCRQYKLEMKLVSVEVAFDRSKILFYFTANGRVDFRDLVKDLASVFKTRVELRQIGVRDEAKMLGGLGACGRPCCCAGFLVEFQPVSIKMAKDQSLSLNPTKISGLCGRLMCCLKYEQSDYESIKKKMPRAGHDVTTPDGIGVVTEQNILRERVKVRVTLADGSLDTREYALDEVKALPRAGQVDKDRDKDKKPGGKAPKKKPKGDVDDVAQRENDLGEDFAAEAEELPEADEMPGSGEILARDAQAVAESGGTGLAALFSDADDGDPEDDVFGAISGEDEEAESEMDAELPELDDCLLEGNLSDEDV